MEFTCCERIISGLNINHSGYKYCCEVWEGPDYIPPTDNALAITEQRRLKIIDDFKNGDILEKCKLCPHLKSAYWEPSDKIKFLTIYNWNHCNASCTYCSNQRVESIAPSKRPHPSNYFDVLPTIKLLAKEKRIDRNTSVLFIGGEPTMLKEFPKVADILLKNDCKIEVLSNAILYEKMITKIIKSRQDNSLCVSLDCGTRETYQKIKRVDKFKEVTSNIKKYVKESSKQKSNVTIKYIVLPNLNDNIAEVDAWLSFCKEANVRRISLSINHLVSMSNSTNQQVEPSVMETFSYVRDKAAEMDFDLKIEPFAEIIIKNGVYNCREQNK